MAKKLFRGQREESALSDYDSIATSMRGQGERATSGYLDRAEAFDPSEAVSTYGQGFMDNAREGLGQDFESLMGESVGSGRLRTGFMQRDAGNLFKDFNKRVSNAIAMQSMEGARMDMANFQGMGRFGTDMYAQNVDLIGGALDRATAERNADPGFNWKGAAGGLLGAAAGSILPGFGTAVGGKLGQKVAEMF